MQMKKLEQIVGGPVFQRCPDGMSVSNIGERLMPHAHSIIQAHNAAIVAMQSTKAEGLVRVGICLENSDTRIPERLSGFTRAHPDVTVDIVSGDAQDIALMMAAKKLDIAILTFGGNAQPQEGDRGLIEQPLVWAMRKNSRTVNELPLRIAVARVGYPWRLAALNALQSAGIAYQIAYLSNISESQLAAIRADLAVAALPLSRVVGANEPICINEKLPKLPYTQMVLRTSVNPKANAQALAAQVLSAFKRSA